MKIRQAFWTAAFLAFLYLHAPAATLYVDLNSTNPVPPYASWITAAANIQDAVDASTNGDLILVTNGVYQGGIVVTNAIGIQSVNGLRVTLIDGGNTSRCVTLADGASLNGFTMTNGNGGSVGGGVYCASTNALVSDCLLIGNSAYDGAGAYSGTLTNCILTSNSAGQYGDGAEWSTLDNCQITNNGVGTGSSSVAFCIANNCLIADNRGYGAFGGTLNDCTVIGNWQVGADGCHALENCIIYYNSRSTGGGSGSDVYQSGMTNCCVGSSFAAWGLNNISNPPAFVDMAQGNYQLQIGSPCINAGNNAYAPAGTDLAGNPRIEGGTVDIGAFESDYTNLSGYHFVSLSSTNPVPPYINWLTAATNIQDAIAVAQKGDTVIVGSGIYASGGVAVHGQTLNRVAITNAIRLLGLSDLYWGTNMAGAIIAGGYGIRGVYVGSNAVLEGLEVTGGSASAGTNQIYDLSGGGVWCETGGVVSNCLITGNRANNYGWGIYGGAVYGSTIVGNPPAPEAAQSSVYAGALNDCVIMDNATGPYNCALTNCTVAGNFVHGAAYSTLDDCKVLTNSGSGTIMCDVVDSLLAGNSVAYGGDGGGALGGTLTDCTLVGNSASYGGGAAGGGTYPIVLNNCVISSNTATYGGGVAVLPPNNFLDYTNCILNNCTLSSNSANYGGGAFWSMLNNCTISNNTATAAGGGIEAGFLSDCTLSGNAAPNGGGADGASSRAFLNSCTLSNNVASGSGGTGGGARDCALEDCLVMSNSASGDGGGTISCVSTNCILAHNTAGAAGGGDDQSTLVNCTVIGNSASVGGGGYNSTAENSILYYNSGGDYYSSGSYSLNYCCTTLPTNGLNNITNEPLFANLAGGDFHLQSESPCINSGDNADITSATDLGGNPRIQGGTVDIGAYEYQAPTSVISYAWLQQYGLPTDGSVDYANLDGTSFNVYQDWVAGLNPTNALSVLAMLPPVPTNSPAGLVVSWESVSNRTYFLQSSTNLAVQPAFTTIRSNIVGQPDITSYMDTNAIGNGPIFYRVGVQ